MRKIILALTATIAMTSMAHADNYDWQHRRYEGHREYRGNGGGNWVAPLFGGLIVGGALMEMSQPRYQQQYQPVCRKVFVGNVIVDNQQVEAYKTICQ